MECNRFRRLLFLFLIALVACSHPFPVIPSPPVAPTQTLAPNTNIVYVTPIASLVATDEAPPIPTASATHEPTTTQTPTPSSTPTATSIPTTTPTPTASTPEVQALMRAFCRYGPGKAYLYSHELKEGDQAPVDGRNFSGSWLWIKPENLNRHCWVSASVVETSGDISGVNVVQSRLPKSTLYGPPQDIQAVREEDRVIVTWERVWMTEDDDRGYLIEATICQNGQSIWVVVHTDDNSYEFNDEQNCSSASGGQLYTVEKHGYTDPVPIPWP